MLHIVSVAVVYTVFQISCRVAVEGAADVIESFLGQSGIQSVNLYLQSDETVLCVVFMSQWLFDGLDAGSWRTEHYGMLAWLRVFGVEELAIDALFATAHGNFHQIAIHLIGAVFLGNLLGVGERNLCQFVEVALPEGVEVFGLLCEGLYLLG